MIYFIGTILEQHTVWEINEFNDEYHDDAISISFPLPYQLDNYREAINFLKQHLQAEERNWLKFENGKWFVNLNSFRSKFEENIKKLRDFNPDNNNEQLIYLEFGKKSNITPNILTGTLEVNPEVSYKNHREVSQTTIHFILTYEDMIEAKAKRIFLSHKSADKPLVREYKEILKTLGFDPWMDEDDIKAGDKLHRSILQGFQNSCAAIFFITPNYIDERYLATEVDYAITEVTARKEFKIITLILGDSLTVNNCQVPELLQQYIYKYAQSQLLALKEILNALPLKLPPPLHRELLPNSSW